MVTDWKKFPFNMNSTYFLLSTLAIKNKHDLVPDFKKLPIQYKSEDWKKTSIV